MTLMMLGLGSIGEYEFLLMSAISNTTSKLSCHIAVAQVVHLEHFINRSFFSFSFRFDEGTSILLVGGGMAAWVSVVGIWFLNAFLNHPFTYFPCSFGEC